MNNAGNTKNDMKSLAGISGSPLDGRFEVQGGIFDLLKKAAKHPEKKGVVIVESGKDDDFLAYATLLEQALNCLSGLRRLGLKQGSVAILCHADSRKFLKVFWACVIGGIVPAATAYPTAFREGNKEIGKLIDISAQIDNPPVLTDVKMCERLPRFASTPGMLRLIDSEELEEAGETPQPTPGEGDDLALIQYSSGSTGSPKGVMITHSNILANMEGMARGFEVHKDDVFGAWLPYHHDFGLMSFHILPIATCSTQVNLSPSTFLRRPALWLQKMQEYGVSVTGSPNFGYMHTLRSVGDVRCGEYDLAKLRLIA